MSRTNPQPTGPEPSGPGPSGNRPDSQPPIDRTQAYEPTGAPQPPPLPDDVPKIPGITLNYEVARGGMGVVYSGRQDFLDRRVAVKLLSRDLAGEKFAQRFRREAKILAGIKHPHIVACHAAGTTEDGQSYLVMEFVDGPNLKAWIHDHGAVPCAAALRLTKSLGQALSHAHQLDVIHRDVKPENILLESVTSTAIDVTFPFTPKLVDLGLARMTSEAVGFGLTSPGAVMGTPTTMSPEQFDDPDSVDFRTDIYGLGCVLFEMLVGLPAYRGRKMTEIVAQKRQPIGPDPCEENPAVPEKVGALVRSMLAADRENRPSSYRDLDERIDALLVALPVQKPSAVRPGHPGTSPTNATMVSGQVVAPTVRPAPTKQGEPSGPGLLRTAELDFLQEGLGQGAPRTAFHESGATTPVPPTAVATRAPSDAGTPPAHSKRGPLLAVLAVLVLAGGGAAAWLATRGGASENPKPVDPGPKNLSPAGEIVGRDRVTLKKGITLEAKATDPEGDRLTYVWSGPDEVAFKSEVDNTVQAIVMDGLPGEKFAIECAISDGKNKPVVVSKVLAVDEADFPKRQFLLGCRDGDSQWIVEPAEGPLPSWTWVPDRPNAWLSCRTLGELRTMTLTMPDDAFWKIEGRLGSRKDDADEKYGETIVRLEMGETGWSLHCRRDGDFGERWSIELRKAKLTAGQWVADPISPTPRRVEWEQAEDAKQNAFASLTMTRRRETLTLRLGRFEEDKATEFEVAIENAVPLKLALSVNGGAGEFRGFTIW